MLQIFPVWCLKKTEWAFTANASVIASYPEGVEKIKGMCVWQNVLYVSCSEQSSGLFSVKMFNREVCWLLRNGEGNVKDIFGICQDQDNILSTDLGAHQIKKVNLTSIVVSVIAGCGSEGNGDGSADCVSFAQISGIYCEGGNIYVVDAQSGTVKLVTRVTGVIKLLDYLGKLYISFSVHLKHQNYDNLSLPDAVGSLKTCADYFSAIKYQAISFQQLEPNKVTNGPKRTVSNKILKSV